MKTPLQILHGQWRLTPKGLQLSLSIVEPTKVGTQDVYAQSQRPIVARVRAKAGVLSEGFDPSDFEPTLEDWGQAVVRRIEKGVGRTRHRTVHFQPLRGRESDQLALDLTDWLWDAFAHSALFTLIEPGIASVPVSDQTDGNLVGRVSIRGEYVKVNLSVFDNRGQLVTSAAVSLKKGLVSHTVIIDVDIRPMYAGAGGGIVRSGPGESHGETGRLEPWSEVGASGTARGGRWLRIERPGGRVGFVRAHLLSTAMPVERRFQDCHGCPEMVVVPAGEFEMGLSPSKAVRGDEVPAHDVRIEYRMAVGMYEVTLAEFRKFVEETNFSAPGSCWAHGRWSVETTCRIRMARPGFSARRTCAGSVRQLGGCAGLREVADREDGRTVSVAERVRVGVPGARRDDHAVPLGGRDSAGTRKLRGMRVPVGRCRHITSR